MASIQKRGNSYRVTVSNGRRPDGTQIIETDTYTPDPGMTKRQIEKALNEFVVDFERDVKSGQNVKGKRMTLKQLADQFIKDMEPTGDEDRDMLAITTWASYKNDLNSRILPRIGHIKITDIIQKTLKDYSNSLRKDGVRRDRKPGGMSESTITRDCKIVSSLLSYAVGEGLLTINPIIYAGRQSKGHKAKQEYKVDYLTIEQVKYLLWALDNPIPIKHKAHGQIDDTGKPYNVPEYTQIWRLPLKWRAYFYLALFVGNRRGENISLTWEDVDMKNGEVNIDESTAYVERKIIHKKTKTSKSRCPVIPPVVIEILKQWKVEQQQQSLELGTAWIGYHGKDFDKNYIFTQENGKQMHPSSPYHQYKRIIRIYNENIAEDEEHMIPPDSTQHDLRHTAASILIANNMDPRSVAGVLGHSDASTTLNIYAYFFRTKNREAADIMQKTLIGPACKAE
ncbi:tyrosine-type recombinase/integrase [Hungatella hathewayi]|uniref:tyrosine-type recombinase/integrase n=1 Tax=Hungatella hathewayi TaxID=154046 RepID=UPI0035631CC6